MKTKTLTAISVMRRRWLTPLDALQTCGLLSLSQRVSELRRQGYVFHQRTVTTASGSRVAAYKLARAPEQ